MGSTRFVASFALVSLACVAPPSRDSEAQGQAGQRAEVDESQDEAQVDAPPNPFVPGVFGDPALQAKLDAALAAKGSNYAPRTEHLRGDGRPVYTNRLIHETSP